MKRPKPAHHWYDALLVCRLLCTILSIFDWSPNSSHWKVLRKWIIEKISPRLAPLTWHIWDSTLRCIAFHHFPNVTFIWRCLDPFFLYFFTALLHSCPHPHYTKHQAFAPSGPMSLCPKFRNVRAEFCSTAWVKAWQETHDLRDTNEAHSTHHTAKLQKVSPQFFPSINLGFISCSKTHSARATYCLTKRSGLTTYNFYILLQATCWYFFGAILELTWFLMILDMSGRTNSLHSPTAHEQMTSTPPLVMSHPSPPLH